MSVFYDDGFQDGMNGLDPSPPGQHTSSDGHTTNVYTMEYMRGYKPGREDFNNAEAAYIESRQPDCLPANINAVGEEPKR